MSCSWRLGLMTSSLTIRNCFLQCKIRSEGNGAGEGEAEAELEQCVIEIEEKILALCYKETMALDFILNLFHSNFFHYTAPNECKSQSTNGRVYSPIRVEKVNPPQEREVITVPSSLRVNRSGDAGTVTRIERFEGSAKGASGLQCGFPGRPANGGTVNDATFYFYRDLATYQCADGFVLFGPSQRMCMKNGTWSGRLPTCEFNLARGKVSQQSLTLLNYRSDLAVDGDPETCSYTPRDTDSSRWWQVNLGRRYNIASVGIRINRGIYSCFLIASTFGLSLRVVHGDAVV
ncbi:unnamed protein product [Darwinula stevensoni]|uniref:Sushi domain-containing protein n=1 Tax=Darwinula stevensoni TaxID=69355 RepID=A0A7R8X6G6_9CRUS|nr:unnamed protein product [Darwinula stevensoni]CAG0882100.1 unnamed protein product [Darwinula stevensoni]